LRGRRRFVDGHALAAQPGAAGARRRRAGRFDGLLGTQRRAGENDGDGDCDGDQE
jgi:hypothetical protein